MQFIRIVDFEKLQHYRDRKPPWIKLYRDLLSDDRLFELSEADRYQLIGLFLLASHHDNLIPNKSGWLKKELGINRPISLQNLIDSGWITIVEQDASKVLHESSLLAEVEHDAIPRALAREETEKRREETEKRYISHGEFGNCRLLADEHEKLLTKLNGTLDSFIDRFDRWIEGKRSRKTGIIPLKYRDQNAYLSILNWSEKDNQQKGLNLDGYGQQRRIEQNQSGSPTKIFGAVPLPYTPKQRT